MPYTLKPIVPDYCDHVDENEKRCAAPVMFELLTADGVRFARYCLRHSREYLDIANGTPDPVIGKREARRRRGS